MELIRSFKKQITQHQEILRKDGKYILFDTHPFVRPFDKKAYKEELHSIFL
jgi:hypothetical protein